MAGEAEEEQDDDYMNMAIEEPAKPREKETYTQRRLRKEREAEQKRPKSRAELAAAAAAAQAAALAKPLHAAAPNSKGLKMMKAMGFQAGDVLGKKRDDADARAEPLGVEMKEGRGGIGLDSERKRKIREEWEAETKRVKADEGDFRERVRREREERRAEGLLVAAQKVAEGLDGDEAGAHAPDAKGGPHGESKGDGGGEDDEVEDESAFPTPASMAQKNKVHKPLRSIPVLWRGLVREREERERERRRRYDLHQSLSRLPTYEENDDDADADDRRAAGRDEEGKVRGDARHEILEEELEVDDPELEDFQALGPVERLQLVVHYLRARWHYCFWCKYRYDDDAMEGCPGLTEDDHD
ncbi:MAG: hypothetical protein M1838_001960 [Thelocarpon superellum]|nr:MAG: hypothetical protein M1838_001960 [Thelocarpon superellum]